jgi:hypothetical protein
MTANGYHQAAHFHLLKSAVNPSLDEVIVDSHSIWAYVHMLLFVYWLGADVGLYVSMAMVKNASLSFETRATLTKLALYVDIFPRVTFALILPVGMHLVRDLGLYPIANALLVFGWTIGVLWSALHLALLKYRGTDIGNVLAGINKIYELLMGLFFIIVGSTSVATGAPVATQWFAVKLVLFGLIFWVILGFDTVFRPFSAIMRMGPSGSTLGKETAVKRITRLTMAWSLLLYLLIAAVAFLGKIKPF